VPPTPNPPPTPPPTPPTLIVFSNKVKSNSPFRANVVNQYVPSLPDALEAVTERSATAYKILPNYRGAPPALPRPLCFLFFKTLPSFSFLPN